MDPIFDFSAELWEWRAEGATTWFMLTVPEDESDQITEIVPEARGFGSVRVEVQIGETVWRTSVFPSSELKAYVLPVKKAVRKAEGLDAGSVAEVELRILLG